MALTGIMNKAAIAHGKVWTAFCALLVAASTAGLPLPAHASGDEAPQQLAQYGGTSRENSIVILGRDPAQHTTVSRDPSENVVSPLPVQPNTAPESPPVPSADNMTVINARPAQDAYPDPFLSRAELDRLFRIDQGQTAEVIKAALDAAYPQYTTANSLVEYLTDRFDIAVEQTIPDPFFEAGILTTRSRRQAGTVININEMFDSATPLVRDFRAFDLRPMGTSILPDGNVAMDRAMQLAISLILGEGNVVQASHVAIYHSGHAYDQLGIPFRFEHFNTPEAAARALESLVRPNMTIPQLERIMTQAGASRLRSSDRYNPQRAMYRYVPQDPGRNLTAVVMRRSVEWIVSFDLTERGRIGIEVSGPYRDSERRVARRFYYFNGG